MTPEWVGVGTIASIFDGEVVLEEAEQRRMEKPRSNDVDRSQLPAPKGL